jgi:lipoprotein-anchoring transpeptidase ErfK/SrfK
LKLKICLPDLNVYPNVLIRRNHSWLKTMPHFDDMNGFLQSCEKNKITPTAFLLIVSVADQTVSLFEHNKLLKTMSCSTSRFGIGQTEGSNRTPLGLHRIAEKIGAGAPAGTVFKARKVVGHVSQPEFAAAKITTRIMWLEGLEPGFNQGGNVDTHARYVYIHGTADQSSIGRPDSCGCVHLSDADLIPLFDLLPGGTLVWICKASGG